eukprot:SM000079S22468  [mRNA]  locus=s79:314227:318495:- [translate_table: standard]
MQYHAMSLADQAGLEVDVVGFAGAEPHAALAAHPRIRLHLLAAPFPAKLPRAVYLLALPLKLAVQVGALLWTLCVTIAKPDVIVLQVIAVAYHEHARQYMLSACKGNKCRWLYLAALPSPPLSSEPEGAPAVNLLWLSPQNPPSIPTLTVVMLACWLRSAAMLIDWHNFGYTLLGLRLGPRHVLVRIHRWYERRYGRLADAHLCVTKAMQHELAENWAISATVLYDKPPAHFHPASLTETHKLFSSLSEALTQPADIQDCCTNVLDLDPTEVLSTGGCSDEGGSCSSSSTRPGGVGPSRVVPHSGVPAGWDAGADLLGKALVEQPSDMLEPGASVLAQDWDALEDLGYVLPIVQHSLVTTWTRMGATADSSATEEGHVMLREGRPAVIVSSTSWTCDEDFGLLLEAGLMYDRRVAALLGERDPAAGADEGGALLDPRPHIGGPKCPFPRLLFIITGKGPQKAMYEERIKKMRLRRVAFRTLWLSPADYPVLLGSADLGVSLHTSSSGLDLPMKVVDMFGCGLPVCAAAYSCIGELVQNHQNGLLFSSSSELAQQLLDVFRGFPGACNLLSSLAKGAARSGEERRWPQEWELNVLPVLQELEAKSRQLRQDQVRRHLKWKGPLISGRGAS